MPSMQIISRLKYLMIFDKLLTYLKIIMKSRSIIVYCTRLILQRMKFSSYIGGTSSAYTWPGRRIYKYICCSRPRQRTLGLCRTSYLGSRNLGLAESFPLTWVKFYSSNKTLYFRYTHSNWQEQKFNVVGVFLLWFSERKVQSEKKVINKWVPFGNLALAWKGKTRRKI